METVSAASPSTTTQKLAALKDIKAQPDLPPLSREFIAKHNIVEQYLSGRLPPRAVTEFERFCRENPQFVDEIGLQDRVQSAIRLLETSGQPEPWAAAPKKVWEQLWFTAALAAGVVVLVAATWHFFASSNKFETQAAQLQKLVNEQPLSPAGSTHVVRVVPSRTGAASAPVVSMGGPVTEFADMQIDVSWSKSALFNISIERIGQGRVAVLHNIAKDSNGQIKLAMNSSALGPGDYQVAIDALDWRGLPTPAAWLRWNIVRSRR